MKLLTPYDMAPEVRAWYLTIDAKFRPGVLKRVALCNAQQNRHYLDLEAEGKITIERAPEMDLFDNFESERLL